MFKVNDSGVFIVNFEHISRLVLVSLLLTLNMQLPAGICNIYLALFSEKQLIHQQHHTRWVGPEKVGQGKLILREVMQMMPNYFELLEYYHMN